MSAHIMANGKEATNNGRLCYCTQSRECGVCRGNPAVEGDGRGNVFCLCCGGAVQTIGRSVQETIEHAAQTYSEEASK